MSAQNDIRVPTASHPAPTDGRLPVELLPGCGGRHGRRPRQRGPHSGLDVQLCGDAHLLNFGLWATPERTLAFDLRDFDQTLPGPFEWDVLRLAASVEVAAQESGVGRSRPLATVAAAVAAYAARMAQTPTARELDIWYDGLHIDSLLDKLRTG